MSFSILQSVPRVGSRAIQAARPAFGQQRSTSWMGFEQPNPSVYSPPPPPPPPQPPQEGGEKEEEELLRQQQASAAVSPTGEPNKLPTNNVTSIIGTLVKHDGFVDWMTHFLKRNEAKKQQREEAELEEAAEKLRFQQQRQKEAQELEAKETEYRQMAEQQAAEAEAIRAQVRQRPYYELQTTKLCMPDHPATFGCNKAEARRDLVEGYGSVRKWRYDYLTERKVTELAQEAAERIRLEAKKRELRSQYREAIRKAIREEQTKPHD
ncbi:hypothetical protein PG993_012830 [Apiospora rasikravindrae]|uniref:Uncharacterized protein n=1 Tax=Apiospora rasikravindrae TaxID=990691 RepID=A0ABR1RW39_9PEZI